jgi:hypothetical protein
MHLLRKIHLPSLLCGVALLVCDMLSWPFSTINFCDDGPYILMARRFAETGHIVYNGWASTMIVMQIYLAGPFIKLFGYSYTTVRMSTLVIACLTAVWLQRTLVRTGIHERNATLATLTFVLSPLYVMLAPTFMSDILGVCALVACLYGCIRALQASTDRAAIAWVCLAVVTNSLGGTSRQIAWLGVMVMVPSTLWLLRGRRRVLMAGGAVNVAGLLFILAAMNWLKQQPYVLPVPLLVRPFPLGLALQQLSYVLLEVPLFLLPLVAAFIPELRKSRLRTVLLVAGILAAYLVIALHTRDHNPLLRLEPTDGTAGNWVTVHGTFDAGAFPGAPILLHTLEQVILTLLALGGALSTAVVLLRRRLPLPPAETVTGLTWKQLGVLLVPFSLAYLVLIIAVVGTTHAIYDRYVLGLLLPVSICLVRSYQERVRQSLRLVTAVLIGGMAAWSVIATHNSFALARARVALAKEMQSQGVAETAIDGGWDYNIDVELKYADHINLYGIKVPANAYVSVPTPPPGPCWMSMYDRTPHIHPVYGIAYESWLCYGPAPFSPVQYSRWPFLKPGTLYAVRYTPGAR